MATYRIIIDRDAALASALTSRPFPRSSLTGDDGIVNAGSVNGDLEGAVAAGEALPDGRDHRRGLTLDK